MKKMTTAKKSPAKKLSAKKTGVKKYQDGGSKPKSKIYFTERKTHSSL